MFFATFVNVLVSILLKLPIDTDSSLSPLEKLWRFDVLIDDKALPRELIFVSRLPMDLTAPLASDSICISIYSAIVFLLK